MKKRKSASDELAKNRELLAEARRRIQVKAAPLTGVGLLLVRLCRDEPLVPVAYMVVLGGLSIHWIVGYRRLKAELGLAGEYDQLDENASWGAKTFVVLFGGMAAFFVLLFWFMSAMRKD